MNSKRQFKEYRIRDYNDVREYKIRHQPKYHEYNSYYEYDKIRNYKYKEYKPIRTGYHGYKATITKRCTKPRLLPKRQRQYRPERWPRQITYCYELPGGPEYPVPVYNIHDYKPKPYYHKYREYNGYKPYSNFPEYTDNVNYQLTPANYYGFRRGNRVYEPVTPQKSKVKSISKPKPDVIPDKALTTTPVPRIKSIINPESVDVVVVANSVPVSSQEVTKRKRVLKKGDNGFYKPRDYTSYYEYDHVHEYDGYYEYETKPYDHYYEYTSKNSTDGMPHLLRIQPIVQSVTHKPDLKPRTKPLVAAAASKPKAIVIKEEIVKVEDETEEAFQEEELKNVESENKPKERTLSPRVVSRVSSPKQTVVGAAVLGVGTDNSKFTEQALRSEIPKQRSLTPRNETPSRKSPSVQTSIIPAVAVVAASNNSGKEQTESNKKTVSETQANRIKSPWATQPQTVKSEISNSPAQPVATSSSFNSNSNSKTSNQLNLPKQEPTTNKDSHLLPISAAAVVGSSSTPPKPVTEVSKTPHVLQPSIPHAKITAEPEPESAPNLLMPTRKNSIAKVESSFRPLIAVPEPAARSKPKIQKSNDVSKSRFPPEVVATISAYNNAHITALNPLGAIGTIRRSQAMLS